MATPAQRRFANDREGRYSPPFWHEQSDHRPDTWRAPELGTDGLAHAVGEAPDRERNVQRWWSGKRMQWFMPNRFRTPFDYYLDQLQT